MVFPSYMILYLTGVLWSREFLLGEDRLLADMAGRNADWPVQLLIDAQACLTALDLDGGAPLHQAAWLVNSILCARFSQRGRRWRYDARTKLILY